MNMFGYTTKDFDNDAENPQIMKEVSVECTLEEIESLIETLTKEAKDIRSWLKNCDPLAIESNDFTEIQFMEGTSNCRLLFLVNLNKELKNQFTRTFKSDDH